MQHKTMHVSNAEIHTSVKTIAKTIGKQKLGNIPNPRDNLLVTFYHSNPISDPSSVAQTRDRPHRMRTARHMLVKYGFTVQNTHSSGTSS